MDDLLLQNQTLEHNTLHIKQHLYKVDPTEETEVIEP